MPRVKRVWKTYEVKSKAACVAKGGGKKRGKLLQGWRWKNGKCVKHRKYRACKRSKVHYDGIQISLPCKARSLTPAMKRAIDRNRGKMKVNTDTKWNNAQERGCRIVFFKTASNPIMRCPDKSLKKQYTARKRAGKVSKKFLRNIKK